MLAKLTNPSILALLLIGVGLASCAEQSSMRLAQNMVRINVSTAPIYGALEPERRAMAIAARETLNSGYDKFIVVDGGSGFHQNVLGVQGGSASGFYGPNGGHFFASGPSTIAMPRFQTNLVIRMFHDGDPAGSNAIDARQVVAESGKE